MPSGQSPDTEASVTPGAGITSTLGSARNVLFLFVVAVSISLFWTPLRTLLDYSMRGGHQYDQYSHTMLIPFVSLALILFERRRIFKTAGYGFGVGAAFLVVGIILGWPAQWALRQLGIEESLSAKILGLVIFWMAGFILCYGTQAFRAGLFPLLFLLLTVPIPRTILDKPLTAVQYGSTEVCSLIFSLVGVPVFRQGTVFSLPNISIEVAKECSGIHSTLALFIVSLLAGHLFLSSGWKKFVLVLFTLPIVCVTNGLRIAILTLLAVYVDASFLYGNLHRVGGIGFFLVAIALLFGILWLLRKGEHPANLRGGSAQSGGRAPATPAKS
jgi:exosortase